MAEKKTVSAKEVVADIRSGATDEFLMKKYGISEKGLQGLFQKLIAAKLLTQADLDRRKSDVEEIEIIEESAAPTGKSLDALKGIGDKFKISKEDLEKLKTASVKDIQEFMEKHNLSLSEAKDLFKGLGISTGNLLSHTAGKIKDGTQQLRDEFKQKQASGDQSAANAAFEMTQERLKKVGDQAVEKAKELQEKVSAEATGLVSKITDKAWFETMWILIVTLLLLYPAGLYGLWKTTRLTPKTKSIMAGAFLLLNIIISIMFTQQLVGVWCLLGLVTGIYVLWRSSLTSTIKKVSSAAIVVAGAAVVWVAFSMDIMRLGSISSISQREQTSPQGYTVVGADGTQKRIFTAPTQQHVKPAQHKTGTDDATTSEPKTSAHKTKAERILDQTTPLRETTAVSECEEEPIPFPIHPLTINAPPQEVLATWLRVQVFERGDSQYRLWGGTTVWGEVRNYVDRMEHVIPKDISRILESTLETQYGCALNDTTIRALRDMCLGVLDDECERAFPSKKHVEEKKFQEKWKTASEREHDKADQEKKLIILRGEEVKRTLLNNQKVNVAECVDGVENLMLFIKTTVGQAIEERRGYDKKLFDRATKIEECKKRNSNVR